jgi:hypothetical protein
MPHSTSKCTKRGKDLRWSFIVQALHRPGVDFVFDFLKLAWGDGIEVRAFREGTTDHAVPIFDASLLPAVIGLAKAGARPSLSGFVADYFLFLDAPSQPTACPSPLVEALRGALR